MSSLRDVISSRIVACIGCILRATARKKSSLSRTDIFCEGNITISPLALLSAQQEVRALQPLAFRWAFFPFYDVACDASVFSADGSLPCGSWL